MTNSSYFKLDTENFKELKEEIKTIIWMYHDMINSYGGFGHNIDFEEVNYERFLLTEIYEDSMKLYSQEVELVKQGSLVALCCKVNDMLDELRREKRVINYIKETLLDPKLEMGFEKEVLLSMLLAFEEEPLDDLDTLEHGGRYFKKLDEV